MTENTILSEYALPETHGQKYPAIQANNYQPRSPKEAIELALSSDSAELLSLSAAQSLGLVESIAVFGGKEFPIFTLSRPPRWIVLALPRMFCYDKDTERYGYLERGGKLAGTRKVTAAKLFLLAVADGEILTTDSGVPQVFTLSLKSSKTRIIKAQNPVEGDGTLYSLNKALQKKAQVKGTVLHLASLVLSVSPETYNNDRGESSIGIKFEFAKALVLPPEQQQLVFELLKDEDLKADIADPYKLSRSVPASPQIDGFEYGDDIAF